MTKTFKRIIIAAVMLIVLAGAACTLVLTGGCSASASNPVEDTKNNALNAVLDASGIKDKIDSELRSQAGEIAAEMGVPQAAVDAIVDSIAVKDWEVTTLPSTATETASFTVDANGTETQITTYDDPSVVTLGAYGQSVTMAVPESAQGYVPYLQYLQYLE